MKYLTGLFFTCLFACMCTLALAQGAGQDAPKPPARSESEESVLWQALQKIAPRAVDKFKAATTALDTDKYEESAKLYREVLKDAPDFEPALRRLGYALAYSGQREEGLKLTKKAVDLNRSVDNLMGHGMTLACIGRTQCEPTAQEASQALVFVREAVQKDTSNEPQNYFALAEISIKAKNWDEFAKVAQQLVTKFPDQPASHYYQGLSLGDRGDFAAAETALKKAESLGMPHENVAPLLAAIEEEKGKAFFGLGAYMQYFYIGLYVVLAWAVGLIALFVAGKILSAKTLSSIATSDPNDVTGGGHAGLRKLYRNVISIAGLYWYISQPVVMLLVAVATGGGILFFFWIGTIPVKLVLIIAFIGLATLFVMVKSLFVRLKTEDPGRALTEEEAPGLWAAVREVAATINTRPVNEIRITPGTDLAVYERGGMRVKMQDKADRILILGTAVLNDFDQNAFRAVLAHEYGHFSNRDTAGGDVAYRVNEHIFRLAEAMGRAGTATVYNIAFQFLRLYHFLFRRITHGATRLQEILADRVAVYQYGAAAFQEGLTHVVRREIEFMHLADGEINASYTAKRALQNLYELKVENDTVKGQLDVQFNEAINRPTTEDDTHPSPADRFKLAKRIRSRGVAPVTGQVWDLFRDRAALTNEMNAVIEDNIRASM
jgi:tetratricopeptide (TPR) repeat protein/Zn-dependent protease with chaperone function